MPVGTPKSSPKRAETASPRRTAASPGAAASPASKPKLNSANPVDKAIIDALRGYGALNGTRAQVRAQSLKFPLGDHEEAIRRRVKRLSESFGLSVGDADFQNFGTGERKALMFRTPDKRCSFVEAFKAQYADLLGGSNAAAELAKAPAASSAPLAASANVDGEVEDGAEGKKEHFVLVAAAHGLTFSIEVKGLNFTDATHEETEALTAAIRDALKPITVRLAAEDDAAADVADPPQSPSPTAT